MRVKAQLITAGVALAIAVGVGYVMQHADGIGGGGSRGNETLVSRSAMTPSAPTVAIARFAQPPRQSLARRDLWIEGVLVPSAPEAPEFLLTSVSAPSRSTSSGVDPSVFSGSLSQPRSGFGLPCKVEASAQAVPGALIAVDLEATCHPHERVTILHNGLRFTDVMSNIGQLRVLVPALTEDARVSIMFDDGEGTEVFAKVEDLELYDRVALQWRGPMGLHIHALERGARYGEAGHVWAGNPGRLVTSGQDTSGSLMQLGDALRDGALMAEVYTYPTAMNRHGDVKMSVEAEITARNCGHNIEGQTLQRMPGQAVKVMDLSVSVPECTAIGDFLVLKNLVQDLTLAQK